MRTVLLLLALLGSPAVAAQPVDAFVLLAEVDRLGARVAWPGFEPSRTPVAVYDGTDTYLFRHPSPPAGFEPIRRNGLDGYRRKGPHPAIVANTSAEIEGILTATVLLDRPPAGESLRDLAALVLHETFHVFQRRAHPRWTANEADLFTYPVDDAALLALRRQETEALRRALAAGPPERLACWARATLALRQARFATLDSASAAYERGTELQEGLATYVEWRAGGRTTAAVLPTGGFGAEEVRRRAYRTGLALALLLDRLAPGWPAALDADDRQALDAMVAARLPDAPAACALPPAEVQRLTEAAHADVAALRSERVRARQAYTTRPGWTLVVTAAEGAPLWPQGFDPLNVRTVAGGVLHGRFLKLGNGAGAVEILGRAALTEAAGPHPLFNGVRRLVIAGLPQQPAFHRQEGRLTLELPDLLLSFEAASVEEEGQTVHLRLPPAPGP